VWVCVDVVGGLGMCDTSAPMTADHHHHHHHHHHSGSDEWYHAPMSNDSGQQSGHNAGICHTAHSGDSVLVHLLVWCIWFPLHIWIMLHIPVTCNQSLNSKAVLHSTRTLVQLPVAASLWPLGKPQ
jgi:hypothetical protein